MIVINNFKYKSILYILMIFLLFSCKDNNDDELTKENTYQVINFLSQSLIENTINAPTFPPPPNGKTYTFTIEDSLRVYKKFYMDFRKKKTVAINSILFLNKKRKQFNNGCSIDNKLLDDYFSMDVETKINVNKLSLSKNNNVLPYDDMPKNIFKNKFEEIDLILNFSKIKFNKKYNKAIITVAATRDKLNGFTALIYLEKENYHWAIKCEKVFEIS
ncbi:hypothetical protein [Polaribacter pacificus]|nr:hypothetical protein [Polaribacter pacificus]